MPYARLSDGGGAQGMSCLGSRDRHIVQGRELLLRSASDVFCSYNWGVRGADGAYDNQERVKQVVAVVEAKTKLKCWLDLTQMESGDNLAEAMQGGIRECAVVLVFLSPRYLTSLNCKRELKWAQEMGKTVLVVAMHPYVTASKRKHWGSASDETLGELTRMLAEPEVAMVQSVVDTFLYFDLTTPAREAANLPLLLSKLLQTVPRVKAAGNAKLDSDVKASPSMPGQADSEAGDHMTEKAVEALRVQLEQVKKDLAEARGREDAWRIREDEWRR